MNIDLEMNVGMFGLDESIDQARSTTRRPISASPILGYGASSPVPASNSGSFRRASIYNSVPSIQDLHHPPLSPPMFDPRNDNELDKRDSNSIRSNITTLINNGQKATVGNGPQGLAGLMGGSSKPPRLHRVNSGITPEEKEITEKLEREMEISRAPWAHKRTGGTEGSRAGISMASVMQGRTVDSKPSEGVAKRWVAKSNSVPIPNKFETIPPPAIRVPLSVSPVPYSSSAPPSAKPIPSPNSTTQPRSMAEMMGSRASGPRLNKPTAVAPPVEAEDGPSHGRLGTNFVAMPGMVRSTSGSVRERARSMNLSSPVEARTITRKPPVVVPTEGIVGERLKAVEIPSLPITTESESPTKEGRNKMQGRWAGRSQSVDIKDSSALVGLKGGEFLRGLRTLPIDSSASLASPQLFSPQLSSPVINLQPPIFSQQKLGVDLREDSPDFDYPPSPEVRGDPSPRFDSPPMDNSSWGELGPAAINATWGSSSRTGVNEARSSSRNENGYVVPSKRSIEEPKSNTRPNAMTIASTFDQVRTIDSFEETPRPWSPSKKSTSMANVKSRPVSINTLPSREDLDMEPPRSPSKSVRSAIASWGTPGTGSNSPTTIEKPPSRRVSREWTKPALEIEMISKVEKVAIREVEIGREKKVRTGNLGQCYLIGAERSREMEFDGILYESEVIVVATKDALLLWSGNTSIINSQVIRALEEELELKTMRFKQGCEGKQLMECFKGQLIVRSGERADFGENHSRLYTVRAEENGIFIEELEFESTSLCSKMCVVVSLADSLYLWSGKFSNQIEKNAAQSFVTRFARGRSITKFMEGAESDHFWKLLGGEEYASAHHWRYRTTSSRKATLYAISHRSELLDSASIPTTSISLLDTGVEHFLLVPASLRNEKIKIKLGLMTSERLAMGWKKEGLPFQPARHVLFFPTIIPRDLRFVEREILVGLEGLNGTATPRILDIFAADEVLELLL